MDLPDHLTDPHLCCLCSNFAIEEVHVCMLMLILIFMSVGMAMLLWPKVYELIEGVTLHGLRHVSNCKSTTAAVQRTSDHDQL